jgi:hypothetical protein
MQLLQSPQVVQDFNARSESCYLGRVCSKLSYAGPSTYWALDMLGMVAGPTVEEISKREDIELVIGEQMNAMTLLRT